ncbi:hypothetical protein OG320_10620 [Microbispora sp. NBC_01189]|uniref:hypothetical protein n=1 Tax=Microbispora sp. NBC_01189 TaxID=2903583 RepID=UPI002E0F05A4|nr:hypothetical protein OG320_10620 [Microbispora sp. NBC_01189]
MLSASARRPEHVSLKTITATKPADFVPSISRAIDLQPDLVVTAADWAGASFHRRDGGRGA